MAACLIGPLATQSGAQVALTWNLSPTTNVAGYNICWGTNSGNYICTNVCPGTQSSATISNLAAFGVFFFAVQAVDSNGVVSVFSNEQSYTNGTPTAPLASTQPATAITFSGATANASVTPQGADTMAYFAYGPSAAYGSASAVSDVGSGTNALAFSGALTGLLPGTTYHFQATASNIMGMASGGDLTFTTSAAAPMAVTQPATAVSSNSAMMNAMVTPEGAATTVYFALGTNTSYGRTNALSGVGSGTSALPVSIGATGLSPGTLYHFQAFASNSMGTVSAGDVIFTTAGSVTVPLTVLTSNSSGVPPVLNLALNNGLANLTISGTVGATFTIMGTTNDMSMAAWSAVTNVTVSNTAAVPHDSSPVAPEDMLGVAFVPGSVTLPVGTTNGAGFEFFNVVMPGDYIILADQVLPGKGYTPRLMVINMPGIVADDACYVNETANFIHYTHTNSSLQLITSGSTIRQIAVSLADWLNVDWTSASEFTYSNGLCQILATVIETEPPSSDPVAGQSPPSAPIVLDF